MNGSNRSGGRVGKKVWTRKRKRRMVSVLDFVLFKDGEILNGNGRTVRANRNCEDTAVVQTDEQKFKKSIQECLSCTNNLGCGWEDAPFFRCSGGRRRNRKFICVSTVRTKKEIHSGKYIVTVLFSIIVEEQSRKIRNMMLKRERRYNEHGTIMEDTVTNFCSCDVTWIANGIVDSRCWFIRNVEFMNRVHSITECGFVEDHSMYFGDFIIIEEGEHGNKSCLRATNGGDSDVQVEANENGGLIAIQLDSKTVKDLTEKGNRIAKMWSPFCVVDLNESTMVTVILRAPSNRTNATRMECILCRTDTSRKCRHEVICEAESKIEREVSGDEYSEPEGNSVGGQEVGQLDGGHAVAESTAIRDVRNDDGGDGAPTRRTGDDTDVIASRNGEEQVKDTSACSGVEGGENDNVDESK